MTTLAKGERVAMEVLKDKGQSNRAIARTLGVSEGTIRYHLRRNDGDGDSEGRRRQRFKADALSEVIADWLSLRQSDRRPANLVELYEFLVEEHGYEGSCRSVQRYVRAVYPKPKQRPYRRIETPPGAQAQVDWFEQLGVDIGEGPRTLYGFAMVLSHSRMEAVIWCERMDQSSWHRAHNEAFRRLGGIPAVLRIDNLKTGIGSGAGPWGTVNDSYRRYAEMAGFHVDACLPRAPEDKGKVERRVGAVRGWTLPPPGRHFQNLSEYQAWTDQRLAQRAQRRSCPATGRGVVESWEEESAALRPCEGLPDAFDVAVTRRVQNDCMIAFEGRQYSVPFRLAGETVSAHGAGGEVMIWHGGTCVARHPRHAESRIVLDPSHYEGEATATHLPPVPLGKMGRRLQELAQEPIRHRSVDFYAALAEVKR